MLSQEREEPVEKEGREVIGQIVQWHVSLVRELWLLFFNLCSEMESNFEQRCDIVYV